MASPDVAVIGGGVIGCAAAAYLAAGGAHVTLYERASVAAGASGRNSGVVQHPMDRELASLHRDSLARYRDLEASLDGAFSLPAEPAGLLYVTRDGDAARAQESAITAAQPEMRPEIVEGAALRTLEPALAPGLAACRIAIGYPVAPAAATRAFAQLARGAGVVFRTSAPVDLALDGDVVAGVRSGGVLERAGTVLVAAGPWSPALLDPSGGWRPIRPIWGVVVAIGLASPPRHVLEEAGIATEPDDPRTTEPGRPRTAAPRPDPDVEFSLVTAAGSSSVGSTFLAGEPEPTEWAPRVLRHGSTFVPAIAGATVLGYRSCARPLAADGRPLVGRVPWLRNAWMAAGHGPWGISTGPASAAQVSNAILGRETHVSSAFDPARFGEP